MPVQGATGVGVGVGVGQTCGTGGGGRLVIREGLFRRTGKLVGRRPDVDKQTERIALKANR